MERFSDILEPARKDGVEIKTFCSFCVNSADGDLMMDDGSGEMFPVPVCENCLQIVQSKYASKFDN